MRGNTETIGTGRKSKKRKFVLVGGEWGNKDGNKEIDLTIEASTTPLNIAAGEAVGKRDEVSSVRNVLQQEQVLWPRRT